MEEKLVLQIMERSLQEGEIRLWETARLKTARLWETANLHKHKLDANSERTVQASWEQEEKRWSIVLVGQPGIHRFDKLWSGSQAWEIVSLKIPAWIASAYGLKPQFPMDSTFETKHLDYIQRKKSLDALCDEGRVSHDYHHYLWYGDHRQAICTAPKVRVFLPNITRKMLWSLVLINSLFINYSSCFKSGAK